MKTTIKRVLPADVFDALELSAHIYGGIGAGRFNEFLEQRTTDGSRLVPYCVWGHARELSEVDNIGFHPIPDLGMALAAARISTCTNDDAVKRINRRKRSESPTERVTFAEWCEELGVTRGEA